MDFNATEISADYDEYGILVIFLGSENNYLMIQFEEDPDEQDIELGMGPYHIERDDQGYGGYGGVKKWTLEAKNLHLEMDNKGKKNLDVEHIRITFDIDKDAFENLREKLQVALGE